MYTEVLFQQAFEAVACVRLRLNMKQSVLY